jgi:formylglycine-generating enzyme required for sulfatase activity
MGPDTSLDLGLRGPRDTQPRMVKVGAFCMDRTEVRVAQYAACVEHGPCIPPKPGSSRCNFERSGRSDHPINCVRRSDASDYCRWQDKRLPTEREWEYAARGSEGRRYPWGNRPPGRSQVCWAYTAGKSSTTAPEAGTCTVGAFQGDSSPFGVLDLAGNVSEWLSDGTMATPSGKCTGEVVRRGGSWNSEERSLETLSGSSRYYSDPDGTAPYIGFRCAAVPGRVHVDFIDELAH